MQELDIFEKKRRPLLIQLEKSRKMRHFFYLVSYSIYIIPFLIIVLGISSLEEGEKSIIPLSGIIMALILGVIMEPFILAPQRRSYLKHFNRVFLTKFVDVLFPQLNFYSQGYDEAIFRNSKLYTTNYDSYRATSYFEGLSKANLKFKIAKISASGTFGGNESMPLFDGMFCVLEVPEIIFPCIQIIGKDNDGDVPTYSLNKHQAELKIIPIVRLNPVLHEKCTIYSVNKVDAYKVLSSNIAQEIEWIAQEITTAFRISFYNNRIYIGLDNVNVLDVKMHISITGQTLIPRLYKKLSNCIDLMNRISEQTVLFKEEQFQYSSLKDGNDDLPYDHLIVDD